VRASGRAFFPLPAAGRQWMDGAVLVLRRRVGETIAIGGGIEVEVVEISRTRVKLGVKAPQDVSVALRLPAAVPICILQTIYRASQTIGRTRARHDDG
jgi:hypothetical protein